MKFKFEQNYLASHLSTASVGQEGSVFALLPDDTEITYGWLFDRAQSVAAMLQSQGLIPGDRVAVQAEKSIEVVAVYLGVILAGGVFLPLNTAYTATELDYFLNDASPRVLICDPARFDQLKPIADQSGVDHVLTLGADRSGTLIDSLNRQTRNFKCIPRGESDLAAILYTSGTTGRSKGAMLTHGNLASNAATLREYWQFNADDVLIHALPIFHVHGLFVAINVALLAGAKLLFHSRFDEKAVLNDFSRATVLMGVPTFYVRLLKLSDLNKSAVADMRLFISGSAPLLAETHNEWSRRTGHDIIERYGLTETGMNTSNPYHGDRRAGTVGYPLPGVEVVVTDPESAEPLPVSEVGSIEVRGPNVFSGYWQMPEKTAEEIRENGFFITGDLGSYDELGYLSIIGRSKDLIISGGYNIYPKEIELLIDDIEGVDESAVIGLPHPDFGEATVAVVVVRPDADLDSNVIKDVLKSDLAGFKQPKKIFFVDELPRNTMGKVQKNILRDSYKDTFLD